MAQKVGRRRLGLRFDGAYRIPRHRARYFGENHTHLRRLYVFIQLGTYVLLQYLFSVDCETVARLPRRRSSGYECRQGAGRSPGKLC